MGINFSRHIYPVHTTILNKKDWIIAAYAGNELGPGKNGLLLNKASIEQSGFNTIILGLLHIGRGNICPACPSPWNPDGAQTGDIIFNNIFIVSDEKLPEQIPPLTDWANLLNQVSISTNLSWSFGGGAAWISDFYTIYDVFLHQDEIPETSILYKNMQILYDKFPAVRCVDIDCEEICGPDDYFDWQTTVVAFAKMCNNIGFSLSISPYTYKEDWQNIITRTGYNSSYKPIISKINLQCYDGGAGNTPEDWKLHEPYQTQNYLPIIAGFWKDNTTEEITSDLELWKNDVSGGFIWNYGDKDKPDPNNKLYSDAILKGLNST